MRGKDDYSINYRTLVSKLDENKLKSCKNLEQVLEQIGGINLFKKETYCLLPLIMWLAEYVGIPLKKSAFISGKHSFVIRAINLDKAGEKFRLEYFYEPNLPKDVDPNDTYGQLLHWASQYGENTVSFIKPFKEYLKDVPIKELPNV